MKELDCVKIVKLSQKNRHFDGTKTAKRPPKIGDFGTIVHFKENFCIVESIDSDGYTIWLAVFSPDELEVIK